MLTRADLCGPIIVTIMVGLGFIPWQYSAAAFEFNDGADQRDVCRVLSVGDCERRVQLLRRYNDYMDPLDTFGRNTTARRYKSCDGPDVGAEEKCWYSAKRGRAIWTKARSYEFVSECIWVFAGIFALALVVDWIKKIYQ